MIFILTAGADTHHLTNISTFDFYTQEKQTNDQVLFILTIMTTSTMMSILTMMTFSTTMTISTMMTIVFGRKLEVVHTQVGGYLIPYNLQLACVRKLEVI